MRLRKRLKDYKRKFGVFGLLFPLLGFAAGFALLWVSLYYGVGFDLIAWVISPKGAPILWTMVILVISFISIWCGA